MNFNDMTVSELRKLAAELGISGRSTMKKAELIAALSADEFVSIIELKAGIAEAEAEEREMNEIRAEIAAEKSHVEALTADKVVPAGMFDPELTYYADGTYVVMRAQGTEQQGIAVGMTVNAGPYQFQAVRFSDGTVKNVAPHVLHRDDIAEQAAYIEEGVERDESATGPELKSVTINRTDGKSAHGILNDGTHERHGSIKREGRFWVLRDLTDGQLTQVKATTFNKLAKRWACNVGVWAEDIQVLR